MSLRVSIGEALQSELERVVVKHLPQILGNTKMVGAITVPDWEKHVSEEALVSTSKGDRAVSVGDNLVSFEGLGIGRKMSHIIQEAFPDKSVMPSGFFHYPPTGFMGWHTNSDVPCQRLYITWAKEAGKSFFRYVDDGDIVTDYDDAGITLRMFDITDKPPYLWHAVGSETDRISIGYRLR